MNLATMRTRFREALAGTAGTAELADSAVDERLNGAYQFAIPNEVPGTLFEGEWTITTASGTGEYVYPDTVREVLRVAPQIGTTNYLSYHTRPDVFWFYYQRTGGNQAEPSGALFYDRTVYLRPVPDAVYTVRVWTTQYPSALSSSGLSDYNHALAVVYYAAREYAIEREMDDKAERCAALYKDKISLIQSASLSRSDEPKRVRSF